MVLSEHNDVRQLIELAKREDLGAGDLSSWLLPDIERGVSYELVAKQAGIFCGREIAEAVLRTYSESITIEWKEPYVDGARFDHPPHHVATVHGPVGAVLSAERVLLNFLQRLCGIATLTRLFVEAIAGTQAKILDTRKTTPGWRSLEKYAVRCGGGNNHRQGLYDAVLIKDNHFAGVEPARLASVVFDMLNRLSASERPPKFVAVEADSIVQVKELLKVVGLDVVLLDNFSNEALREAVILRNNLGLAGKVLLEASGGITLNTVRAVAQSGVDRISVGALTHSAPALDLSMECG